MYRRGWSKRRREYDKPKSEAVLIGRVKSANSNIIKELFKAYYKVCGIVWVPSFIEKREFAFQMFDREAYVRHLSFSSREELEDFVIKSIPRHIYYSTALYEVPDASDMESKGWLGSELMFDIDVDHIPGCMEVIDDSCIMKGYDLAVKLMKILKKDFNIDSNLYFTGNRGFHVIASCEWCLSLGKDERREIARYILLEGFDATMIVARRAKNIRPLPPSPDDPGPRWRIAEHLDNSDKIDIVSLESAAANASIPIDFQVTQDPSRLARLLYSLNGKAGLQVKPVKEGIFEVNTLSPFKGYIKVKALKSLGGSRVLGVTLSLREGEIVEIEAGIAIYLALKGYVELVEGEASVGRGSCGRPI